MANEKIFNSRFKLKYDTHEQWIANDPVLLAGEIAIATVSVAQEGKVNAVPAVLMKVGDGTSKYSELEFVNAKAADVYSWAKAKEKPVYAASEITGISTYIAEYVTNEMGIQVDTDHEYKITKVNDYQYKLMGKAKGDADYTIEAGVIDIVDKTADITANANAIVALNALVGDTAVATQIANQITALKLAETYEAKGAAAQALKDAKAYTDEKDTAMDARVDALEAKFGEGEGNVESQIAAAVKVVRDDVDALEQAHATDKATLEGSIAENKTAAEKAQGDVDALAGKVGEVTEGKTVVEMISEAVAGEKERAEGIESGLNTRLAVVEADYLKAADKTELAGDIDANAKAIEALAGKVGDTSVQEQLTPVTNRVAAIEADYLKKADKDALIATDTGLDTRITKLEGTITGLSGAMHFVGVKDEIPADVSGFETGDVIIVGAKEYVFNEGAFVEFGDVSAEGERLTALETHQATYEAKVGTLETEMDAVEKLAGENAAAVATKAEKTDLDAAVGRITTAEGDIEALEGEVAKKATKVEHDALAGRVTATEGKITTLEGEMDAVESRATALEEKVGDTAVAAQIKAAIDALKIGDYAKAADLTDAIARIAQNETDIDALEGRATNLETEVAKKANSADLHAVATSGKIEDLEQAENTYVIFDCGSSSKNI